MMDEGGSSRPEGWSSVGCEDRVGGGRGGHALGKVARTNIFIRSLKDHLHSKPIIVSLSALVVFAGLRVQLLFVPREVLFDLIIRSGGLWHLFLSPVLGLLTAER